MVKSEQKIQSETASRNKALMAANTSPSTGNKKKYKGVRMRSWGSWVSEIRAPNQKTRIWLGSYSTAEAAARAYDAALLCLKGSTANLNFPISSSSHYIPDTPLLSPKSIQRVAAAAAANTFLDNATTTAAAPSTATTTTATTTTPVSSPSPSSSSSSMSSSPSLYDQLDDVSLMQSFATTYSHHDEYYSWYNFDDQLQLQLPKFLDDQMFINNGPNCSSSSSSINPPPLMTDDFFFEGDFGLWSFAE